MNTSKQNASSVAEQSIDKRQHRRRPLHSSVRIIYDSAEAQSVQLARGVDVSDGGVAFDCDSDLDFYGALRLEYTDDDGENFCRTARLLHRMNRRYGACFVGTDHADSRR